MSGGIPSGIFSGAATPDLPTRLAHLARLLAEADHILAEITPEERRILPAYTAFAFNSYERHLGTLLHAARLPEEQPETCRPGNAPTLPTIAATTRSDDDRADQRDDR